MIHLQTKPKEQQFDTLEQQYPLVKKLQGKQIEKEKSKGGEVDPRRSYAEVVKEKQPASNHMNNLTRGYGTEATIHIEKKEWLHNSLVGNLERPNYV